MQHDLFVNPSRRGGRSIRSWSILQADIVEGDSRIVAPLTTTAIVPNPPTRALPLVIHDGQGYVVMMRLLGFLPARQLGSAGRLHRAVSRRHLPCAGLAVLRDLMPWKPADGSIAAMAWNWRGRGWRARADGGVPARVPQRHDGRQGDGAGGVLCRARPGDAALRLLRPRRERRSVRGRHHRPLDRRMRWR